MAARSDNRPQSKRLREMAGICPKRAAKITPRLADQKVIREIVIFLHEYGLGPASAVRKAVAM